MALKLRRSRVDPPPPICPLTMCMKLLGGAWTPNVVWFLSACPRRFGELRADIPRISAKTLSARLRALESKGVVINARPSRVQGEFRALMLRLKRPSDGFTWGSPGQQVD